MPDRRQEIIDTYRQMRAGLTAALDGLSEAQMLDRSLGEWCVKDILAHIAMWDELRVTEIERVAAGGRSVFLDMHDSDAFNDAVAAMRWDVPLTQVRWEFDYTRRRLLEAIERAPASAIDDSLYGHAPLLSRHDEAHTEQIIEWRKERGI